MVFLAHRRRLIGLAAAALATMAVGCSETEFELIPVSGTVTLDGEPLQHARVSLEPMKTSAGDPLAIGPASYGETDAAGRFELETLDEERGAVAGLHRVRISTYLAEFDPSRSQQKLIRGEQVPAYYGGKGALEFQVSVGGTETADFALQSTLTSKERSRAVPCPSSLNTT